jgi:uncharacterized protein (TIGR03083 family)
VVHWLEPSRGTQEEEVPLDPTTILADARSALEATASRTAELVRSLPDLNAPLPGQSTWTAREAAIHLVNYAGVYTDIANGMPSPVAIQAKEALAAENARRIAEVPERDPEKVTDLMTEGVTRFLDSTASRSGDQRIIFHENTPMDLAGLVCICVGEHLLHGYDIATAVGSPWPIDPHHAELVLYGYGPVYANVLNPATTRGLTASYGIELRGGPSFTVRFVDGTYSLEPPDSGAVDCTISADPVAYLLVAAGRMTQWEAIALGLISAGGKRPELALGFVPLFVYP